MLVEIDLQYGQLKFSFSTHFDHCLLYNQEMEQEKGICPAAVNRLDQVQTSQE